MSARVIEQEWEEVLRAADPRVREIAKRASVEPALRRLFPYVSMRNLRFSLVTEYPFDRLPYVVSTDDADTYEARDADNRPFVKGDLDVVVSAVANAMTV